MKVGVIGLWHLGSVTAACLARVGHAVIGWDPDAAVVAALAGGQAPVAEPGLNELLAAELASERLHFTSTVDAAVGDADVVWIAFDTPVDDHDHADVETVMAHVRQALPHLRDGSVVISSSQLPVGSVSRIEREFGALNTGRAVGFVCVPENLRLGTAIERFMRPDRVVIGARTDRDHAVVASVLSPVTDRIVGMRVESAEMTKHAINAFLGTSVTFINEIAAICETVGADAKEVERGLKSDQRIGPGAYLSPGSAFAGGTLARDLVTLEELARSGSVPAPLLTGVRQSNRDHNGWAFRALTASLSPLAGRRIAIWGLTYKPGTDTLRRSSSVELCRALADAGANVTAFDPVIHDVPTALEGVVALARDPLIAAEGADAIVVATEWPILRDISAEAVVRAMAQPLVVDAGRFLAGTLGTDARVRYVAVGTPRS